MPAELSPQTLDIDWNHLDWNRILDDAHRPIFVVVLIVLALAARWLANHAIDRTVRRAVERISSSQLRNAARRALRARTMGQALRSIVSIIIVAVFGTMVLAEVGLNIAPILASAGILGIALGFGAQSLVRDFLAGVFLILEDQFGVGDVVDIGNGVSGQVEAVSLRVTRLRGLDGTVWYVPNGEILRVGNMSQNWSRAVLDVKVSYNEDVMRVRRILGEVAESMREDDEYRKVIIDQPEVQGVDRFEDDGLVVRMLVKTVPLEQWTVSRELLQRIKNRFDYEKIEIALPQRVVWNRQWPTPPAEDDGGSAESGVERDRGAAEGL